MTGPRLVATYRLQFHREFPFAAAEALVPYLKELGISHLYASPVFAAVPGSQHGYDVTDPNVINPELGGEEGFARLSAALKSQGMGLVLDIVPNHMATSTHNPYWMEVLEFGRAAPAARLFDIGWEAREDGRILLPVLGDPLQASLEAGAIALKVDYAAGRVLAMCYGENGYPLAPAGVARLLAEAAGDEPTLSHAAALWAGLAEGSLAPEAISAARAALGALPESARRALDARLAASDLSAVLEAQHWRLAWWRMAADDLNYRRFFNITDLIGVRVEDPLVFAATHARLLDLVRAGTVDAVRVDHIDGLADPAAYLDELRAAVGPGIPIFVEKILERHEALRDWPIEGTTGYERLNDINGLFLDEAGWNAFAEDLRARNLLSGTAAERVARAKAQVLEASLVAETGALVRLARDGLDEEMRAGDLTETALRRGVIALLVHCPVYRSYATAQGHTAEDEAIWDEIARSVAAREDPLTTAAAGLLLERMREPKNDSDREFRTRFQQVSGPAMAKGFEDTELYCDMTLLSANEVGGDIAAPWRSTDEMHAIFAARAQARAIDLTPLATHDTKRGPDTRARLNVLSQYPELWLGFVDAAEPLFTALRQSGEGRAMPDDADLRLIHQTLYAAWPITAERMDGFLTKALREAKRHSSWETPDEAYESACLAFARTLIEGEAGAPYRAALAIVHQRLDRPGRILSLSQTLLQLTLPGTPDIYRGIEFRDFSLVDPDNRRPVDWNARLAALTGADGLAGDAADLEKFALTRAVLALRRAIPALSESGYRPVAFAPSPWRWFGFVRGEGEGRILVVVPTRVPASDVPASISLLGEDAAGWDIAPGSIAAAEDGKPPLLIDAPLLVVRRKGA